ncbi:bifunctional metallophosphatase/5'-nucleotidase [Schleiferia thermophila]|jgi:2',3'-cyclic-nucleotide 2'-phosphodiesterase (5'-nucleotidase family)|uniref:2',3'-cyclic-nucleotide 2'-phosphodiesterase (5'-nucleotidase family) n=1 Tax=Schleiferia thermophila TaxID=884107 RepID=A0A368ZZ14_9FLAO|nr:5'-nucleotidase C-terminal domain-containing protein [Schleiferia thermophila]KFD38420.1 metallophosphoesterase [Schleiferia thermophila str. Yellowstone]PMB35302.1 bifunctional metallophosphatase/5'-nucleotidase [Fischerella thermalis CCMEE 5319]RCX02260.1 2',3'-cyclic-nucleotide 2'-phosphodiesterase (5'-nucleotidase family) [Schleiferia thermophila]GCD80855.1 bifunctional metallophosphatase/5'-nucleotidase [Schleiferia thermophila]
MYSEKRRNFLKKVLLSTAGLSSGLWHGLWAKDEETEIEEFSDRGTSGRTILNILQTTDVHCQVFPHDELFWENNQAVFRQCGGYAHLASFFAQERKRYKNTFIVDTGDMFQGSELSVKTTGKALVPILNYLNYDLYLPGNWEVVYYKSAMQDLMGSLRGPKVCANMFHDAGNGKKGEMIFPPYYIWNVAGIKIGFLGYTDPLVPKRQSPAYSRGIVYTEPEENLAHFVEVLRNQEKCAYVIILAHLGLSQQIYLSNQPACEGVDIILGGDTHERVRRPIQGKYAKVVEPGAFGSFVGRLQLVVQDGKIVDEIYKLEEVTSNQYQPDQKLQKLIDELEKPFAEDLHMVIGYSTLPLYRYFVIENTIDTLILDAMRWQLPDADIVLSNGFRFCPPRVKTDHTDNIPITSAYLYDMFPVDATLRTGQVTGEQISQWIEKELHNVFAQNAKERFGGWVVKFDGMKVTFKAYAGKGQRVQSITIGGQPLDNNRMYTIVACEREGDPEDVLCRFSNVRNAKNLPISMHSMIRNYLAANSPVTPTPKGNAIALDAPSNLLTQVYGVDYQFV